MAQQRLKDYTLRTYKGEEDFKKEIDKIIKQYGSFRNLMKKVLDEFRKEENNLSADNK